MYFRGLHVDGFGVFHNSSVRDLPNGLIVFSGDNECGKTTLMQFFRMVLFGPSRSPRNPYPPLNGGRHGGRLELQLADGRIVIVERIEKNVTIDENGGTFNQEPSLYLLNGVDRQTYERVFAMGLEDLQGFDVLTQEGVRGRLLAAGAGLGAASVPETLKQLDRQIAELLTPGGRVQRIPTLNKELAKVRSEIRDLRSKASEFARVTSERDQLRQVMAKLKEEHQVRRLRNERLLQLERSREVWIRLDAARTQITTFEHARSFPLNGLEQLNSLSHEIDKLDDERTEAEEVIRKLDEQLAQRNVDTTLLKCRKDVEQLIAERQKLASALDDLPTRKSDVERFQSDFAERLAELGTAWDALRLANVDTSVQVRQDVQQFARELSLAENDVVASQHDKQTAEEQHNHASEILGETKGRFGEIEKPPISDPTELQRRRSIIRTAQSLLHQVKSTEVALDAQRRLAMDSEQRLDRLRRQTELSASLVPKWVALVIVIVGFLLAVVLAILGDWLVAVAAAALGIAGAILVLWLNRYLDKQTTRFNELRAEEASELQQSLKAACVEVERLDRLYRNQSAKLESHLKTLGIPVEVETVEEQLIEREGEVERCSEQLRNWMTLVEQVAQQERDVKKAAKRLKERSHRFSEATKKVKSLQERWRSWLESRGFDQVTHPNQFEVVLQVVDAARQAQKSLNAAEARLGEITNYVHDIVARLLEVSRKAQVTLPVAQPGVETIDFLSRQLECAIADDVARRNLILAQNGATREVKGLAGRIADKQQKKNELLLLAGTDDEGEFRERAAAHESWKGLHEKITQDELEILTIAGTKESLEEIVSELSSKGPPELAAEKADVDRRIDDIEHELSRGDQRVGELNKVLADMAVDEKLGDQLLRERSLVESLTRATKRWAVLAICRSLVEKAREVYERERQPSVIRAADRFLRLMVNDRYRIVSALDEHTIKLESDDLERKHEMLWSSGLSDQVYLATRLGLASEFAKHSEPLPVIFDDVLVRFDVVRRMTAARALLEVAAQQQILLFSCHPEVVGAIRETWEAAGEPRAQLACFKLEHGRIMPMEEVTESPIQTH
ncbi:MAG TPA: AAA family ATPase [Pirellulaceae bacterium]|nr:AAA family ATPase [Pirellulaceae bacterium]